MNNMMDKIPGLNRLTPQIQWAFGGFIAAAAVSLMIPATILESFISAIGLPEMIAASAPPLGVKARLIIALFSGIIAAAIVFVLAPNTGGISVTNPFARNDDDGEDESYDTESKPTIMERLRGLRSSNNDTGGIRDLSDLPKIRNADAHPDAPARRPLFAGEELAGPSPLSVKPFADEPEDDWESAQMPAPSAEHQEAFEPEYAMSEEEVYQEPVPEPDYEPEPAVQPEAVYENPSHVSSQPVEQADLSDLPINELVDRLEESLTALKSGAAAQRAAAPATETVNSAPNVKAAPEQEAVQEAVNDPVPDAPQPQSKSEPRVETQQSADDMDEALKAALATLQRMTSK